MAKKHHGILFDLDGTLLDTAPDIAFALNRLREENHLPALPFASIQPLVSEGSKIMVKFALGMDESNPEFAALRERFLDIYEEHLANTTTLYPGIETVLKTIESQATPWCIVTNKLTRHATKLLRELRMHHRPACIICGDSLSTYKPDPAPLLHACKIIQVDPRDCLYIGDSETDVIASKSAGLKSLVALYGYIGTHTDPMTWQADGYIKQPEEILNWL